MKRYRTFIEKNLQHFSQVLQESVFAEETAVQPGWLQKVDPRTKVVGFLLLIVATSFARNISSLLILFGFSLILVAGSKIFSFSFLRRLWFFIPLYTALIATPALFLTPGDPIARIPGLGWNISDNGLKAATLLELRVIISISFLLLLVLTTRWAILLKALRSIGFPHFFVFLLAMTYRYIYVLLQSMNSLFLARQSRKVGPEAWRNAKEWLGTISGALLGKSYSLSSEVYLAMVSRGFKGEPVVFADFKMRSTDWLWLLSFGAIAGVVFCTN
jgi:cobalt/nickel transport system permease protein